MEGFYVESARRLTGMRPQKVKEEWVYLNSANVLAAARLRPIQHYMDKH